MALSKFLNSTYDQYVTWHKKLDLEILIHYYVLLKNTGRVSLFVDRRDI